jgi:hypothetical protein
VTQLRDSLGIPAFDDPDADRPKCISVDGVGTSS